MMDEENKTSQSDEPNNDLKDTTSGSVPIVSSTPNQPDGKSESGAVDPVNHVSDVDSSEKVGGTSNVSEPAIDQSSEAGDSIVSSSSSAVEQIALASEQVGVTGGTSAATESGAEPADQSSQTNPDVQTQASPASPELPKSVAPVKSEVFRLPNAMVGREYMQSLSRDDLGLRGQIDVTSFSNQFEAVGLRVVWGEDTIELEGVPLPDSAGEKEIVVGIGSGDESARSVRLQLFINADPRSLWKEIEPDSSLSFRKEHVDSIDIRNDDFFVVGASRRGRSHANEGKFREDHCSAIELDGWMLLAVSDGAGSAPLSRLGSELACNTALESLKERSGKLVELSGLIENGALVEGSQHQTQLRKVLYELLAGSALAAAERLKSEATTQAIPVKDLSCTLLLSIVKKINGSTFIASFGVGDGAIGVFKGQDCWSKLMNKPDGGEFSGQTRFLTMPEIFADYTEVMNRIDYIPLDDFTSLFLMSDGVSDAKFGTDANLQKNDKWSDLADEISKSVDLSRTNAKAGEELLEWLNFWVQGEHDDRTIVILSK